MERKAGSAKHLIAHVAIVAVRIAHGNTTIGAPFSGIAAARISDCILYVRSFYDSALHGLNCSREVGEQKAQGSENALLRPLTSTSELFVIRDRKEIQKLLKSEGHFLEVEGHLVCLL